MAPEKRNGRYRFVNNTFILRQGQVSPAIETFEGIESLEVHNNVFFRVGGAPIDKMVLETRTRWVAGRVSTGSEQLDPNRISAGSNCLDRNIARH